MRKLSKLTAIFAAFILACAFIGCDNNISSSYNMHYFFTDYGLYSAMIRSPENSNVAILATTESGKGGDLYESTFIQLTKSKTGETYIFEGSKNGTLYKVEGFFSAVSNGTTNDSFTIQSSSQAMQNLGFTVGKSIQHWTEKNSGVFVY